MSSDSRDLRLEDPKLKVPPLTNSRAQGTLALLICTGCWGTTPVFLRFLTDAIDGWTANGVRYPLAAAVYWPVLIVAARRGELTRVLLLTCLPPAFFAFAGQLLWGLAPYYLEASVQAFFVRMSLVWSLVGAMILFPDERALLGITRFRIGIAATLVGFVAMAVPNSAAPTSMVGVAIIFFCSMFFGFYAVSVRRFLSGVKPILAFAVVSQYVSVATLSSMFAFGEPARLLEINGWEASALLCSTFLGIVLGHSLLYTSVGALGPSITSGVQTLTPFITVLVASTVLQESLSVRQWVGGILMVCGSIALLLTRKPRVVSSR